jgi:hypothetical protein
MQGFDVRSILDAGILIALFYIGFGDLAENWKRITNTVHNRDAILNVLEECAQPSSFRKIDNETH